MKFHWQNWSGSLRFEPGQILTPATEEEAARVVRSAAEQGRVVRVVGAGHSSSPLVETRDILLSLEKLRGMESHDSEARVIPSVARDLGGMGAAGLIFAPPSYPGPSLRSG